MKPEDIENKKIAVLCDTTEKAKVLLEMCIENYFKMSSDLIFGFTFEKKKYLILERGTIHFCRKEWCESYGYTMITFEQFMQEPQEEQLSAEEVLEVLVSEYISGKYDEIFGCDPCLGVLTRKITPAEIVRKVTEWKRKQDKPLQVTEDMITDALDEKYGIGNWGRK